tara:strand:- start:77 stop:394 length:318 start_codon:yes stop_codon:yes gene_type:complete
MSKITDNYHTEFPARMSDGRFITDYTPNCQHNLAIQNNMTSWQYRVYLTRYSSTIMDNIDTLNKQYYGCGASCDGNTVSPNRYSNVCNSGSCKVVENNPNGIGLR